MSSIIEINELRKSYKEVQVLTDVNINVQKGTIYGLLGSNGAGKSTVVDCALGLRNYDYGHVKILGLDPAKHRKEIFQRVSVQFQQFSFPDKIKVYEQCALTASLYENCNDWMKLLENFDLLAKKSQYIEDLSGGEKQKLAILLALIPAPEIIFLDELTTGLDSEARRDVWKYLKKTKESGVTIFLISHFMDEVENLCDYLGILQNGFIKEQGSVEKLIKQSPYNNLEEAYLYYINRDGGDTK